IIKRLARNRREYSVKVVFRKARHPGQLGQLHRTVQILAQKIDYPIDSLRIVTRGSRFSDSRGCAWHEILIRDCRRLIRRRSNAHSCGRFLFALISASRRLSSNAISTAERFSVSNPSLSSRLSPLSLPRFTYHGASGPRFESPDGFLLSCSSISEVYSVRAHTPLKEFLMY